jgi:N-acetylmuramoyl-L-alanine amidase
VDPGHGGVETGAIGPSKAQEKDVALDLARRLKAHLQQDPSVGVVLTRDEGRLVPLDERTAIANHNHADLFLSIHLNSSKRKQAYGAETYFLSPEASDDDARTVAALENRAYDSAGSASRPPAGGGAGAPIETEPGLNLVLWDLAQNEYLAESGRLAESIQSEMNALAGTRNRGVRQAPFRVLMGATMPAVLVEVGFLSNPEEDASFRKDEHKAKVVEAIARAIAQFRQGAARFELPRRNEP